MDKVWHLEWSFGSLDLHSAGGMLGGVFLKDGAWTVRPFYEAPWIGEAPLSDVPSLLDQLRSEFPCVPFGSPSYPVERVIDSWKQSLSLPAVSDPTLDASDSLLHGYVCVGSWDLIRQTESAIEIAVDYPQSSAISRVSRVVSADLKRPAINFSLTVEARKKSRWPMGVHPNFALPSAAGAFRIEPGKFRFGVVHPAGPEPGVSRGEPGALFEDLAQVPMRDKGRARFDRLPFAYATEEIVQLCGIDGSVKLFDDQAKVAYRLTWDASILPSLLLWISNRGRSYPPWNSRNVCVGVEPLIGTFDLGHYAASARNPINEKGVDTARTLIPGEPTEVDYRVEVIKYE